MSNPDRSDSSVRLTPASPPDTIILRGKSRRASPWWFDDRVLNALCGFGMAAAICIIPEWFYAHLNNWMVIPVLAVSFGCFLAAYFAKKRHGSEFEPNIGWMIAGALAGIVLVAPLAITPECGWNNDKCVVINHVRHRVK
jgi:hypothetical protein